MCEVFFESHTCAICKVQVLLFFNFSFFGQNLQATVYLRHCISVEIETIFLKGFDFKPITH